MHNGSNEGGLHRDMSFADLVVAPRYFEVQNPVNFVPTDTFTAKLKIMHNFSVEQDRINVSTDHPQ
jgi:hypothetical protein